MDSVFFLIAICQKSFSKFMGYWDLPTLRGGEPTIFSCWWISCFSWRRKNSGEARLIHIHQSYSHAWYIHIHQAGMYQSRAPSGKYRLLVIHYIQRPPLFLLLPIWSSNVGSFSVNDSLNVTEWRRPRHWPTEMENDWSLEEFGKIIFHFIIHARSREYQTSSSNYTNCLATWWESG